MNKEKETAIQSQPKLKQQGLMYSEWMQRANSIFKLENIPTTEQSTKVQPPKQDHTIEVTFLKRSKNSDQK